MQNVAEIIIRNYSVKEVENVYVLKDIIILILEG